MKKSKGFTLIELLVVIAIIALLATIVLVSLTNNRQKAKDARRVSDLRQITLALEMYAEDNNRVYPDGGDTVADPNCNDWAAVVRPLTGIQGPNYITILPVDPNMTIAACNVVAQPAGCYNYESDGTDYVLRARLERATDKSLVTDIDVSPLGCVCTDNQGVAPDNNRYYCIEP